MNRYVIAAELRHRPSPGVVVRVYPARRDGKTAPAKPYEVTISPGERVSVWLRVDRHGNDGIINLDVEGLPHGVIVDSIGLNGVQIRAGENEREVFLSCAKWVPEQDRLCHLVAGNARANESVPGQQASFPVLLKVRKAAKPGSEVSQR